MLFEDVDGKILLRDSRFCVRTCMHAWKRDRKKETEYTYDDRCASMLSVKYLQLIQSNYPSSVFWMNSVAMTLATHWTQSAVPCLKVGSINLFSGLSRYGFFFIPSG